MAFQIVTTTAKVISYQGKHILLLNNKCALKSAWQEENTAFFIITGMSGANMTVLLLLLLSYSTEALNKTITHTPLGIAAQLEQKLYTCLNRWVLTNLLNAKVDWLSLNGLGENSLFSIMLYKSTYHQESVFLCYILLRGLYFECWCLLIQFYKYYFVTWRLAMQCLVCI